MKVVKKIVMIAILILLAGCSLNKNEELVGISNEKSNVYRASTGLGLSVSGSHPEKFDTTIITVNGVDDYSSIIKDKTVTFTLSSADKDECNGTISCGDFSITLTNGDRKYWLPMALLNQPTWYNNDATYGWW